MVADDTLSEIAKKTRALRVHGDNDNSILESINSHLMTIKKAVAKRPEHGKDLRDWLREVTDVVTDLMELVEDAAVTPKRRTQLKQIESRLEKLAGGAREDPERQETAFPSRDAKKEEVIKSILSGKSDEKGPVVVILIEGMKGIGKTTLAKSIRNEERVKRHFDFINWIDGIPDEPYADFLVKREKETPEDEESVVEGDSSLEKGRRFLLVLDDFLNNDDEEWKKLLQALEEANALSGVTILATTNNILVLDKFHLNSDVHHLKSLDEQESRRLFQQIAGGGNNHPLSDSEMIRKCLGNPLAIVTMARMIKVKLDKGKAELEQETLLEEFKQEMQMIHYYDLRSWHLKQCFSYSSLIFSSDYDKRPDPVSYVKAETLIRLWMAEGFMGPVDGSSQTQPEDIGWEYMRELEARSIFSFRTVKAKHRSLQYCSFEANSFFPNTFVARDDNLLMDDLDMPVEGSVRRVSLTSDISVSKGNAKPLFQNAKQLRTLLFAVSRGSRVPHGLMLGSCMCDAILSTFQRLRALILKDLGMNKLPKSIGKLKSLRYLDLSYNNMKKLPNCIGKLKYLQTLILSHCHELLELPDGENYYVGLRHLELERCLHLTHMPSALKTLTCLRTLSHFVTSSTITKKDQTGGLWELANLNNLRGELEILHLERLRCSQDGQFSVQFLSEKEHLECLTLTWNHSQNENSDNDSQSLRCLEPHRNLKVLSIVGYEGIQFSAWLSSLHNLVKFSLYNCPKCEKLPPLDQLRHLEILHLQRLDALEYVVDNPGDQPNPNEFLFPSLKTLIISDCPRLKSWWKGRSHNNARFESLSILEVKYCPKLECMPLYPGLDDELLIVSSCLKPLQDTLDYKILGPSTSQTYSSSNNSLPLSKLRKLTFMEEQASTLWKEWPENFKSLWCLTISQCEGLKSLMTGLKHLTELYQLKIENCTESKLPSDEWKEGLKNLHNLYIIRMPKLVSLPEEIEHLCSLEDLVIDNCPELMTLPGSISKLGNLTFLHLEDCNKLGSLPQVKSLNELIIKNCIKLYPRCQEGTGEDWPQIQQIKNVTNHYDDVLESHE